MTIALALLGVILLIRGISMLVALTFDTSKIAGFLMIVDGVLFLVATVFTQPIR